MKYSLYLISALILISSVSAGNYYHHRHHRHNIEFNDLESDLVYFGANFIFQRAADRFGVADTDVQVTRINRWGTRVWNNEWTLYWFNVDATNNNDARVDARFGVNFNHVTGERSMGRWSYHIHLFNNNNNDVNVEVNPIANEENEAEGAVIVNEESAFVESELGFDEGGANGENIEAESEVELQVESEAEAAVGGESTDFEDVPQDQQNDPVINNALQFGAAFIFNDAANNFGLSDFGILVTDIEGLQSRNAGDDHTQYSAHVQATNDEDVAVDARFIVDVNNANQDMAVVGHWSYVILDNANEEAPVNLEEEAILGLLL